MCGTGGGCGGGNCSVCSSGGDGRGASGGSGCHGEVEQVICHVAMLPIQVRLGMKCQCYGLFVNIIPINT